MVNEPGDSYEQEAERVADDVMRIGARHLATAREGTHGITARIESASTRRDSRGGADGGPSSAHEVAGRSGAPLDAATRAVMEPRFGHDFGHVRVHTDTKAAESARQIDARAYTVGNDSVFGEGEYQ